MAMGRRKAKQQGLWMSAEEVVKPAAHPYYGKLNEILKQQDFDRKVEHLCQRYYHETLGRPSLTPGVYFRILLLGYLEGIDGERGIAWRVADSLSMREFLGYSLTEATPDHSIVSRTRRLFSVETHRAVFRWLMWVLGAQGVLQGQRVGIDATTLEANAALRSIERRDDGRSYEEYLKGLAEAEGIEEPTREQMVRLDRKREKKASNKEWKSRTDADARIAKMKDGSTHLAHKAEHAVDLASGAIVAVTLNAADQGDTATVKVTLAEARVNAEFMSERGLEEVVADKGYHSGTTLLALSQAGVRSYIPEPQRGRRNWSGRATEQLETYANRRRVRGDHGRQLLKRRSELVERSFTHMYDTGGMRRTHLRGRDNILKRLLIHAAAFNLALLMRIKYGMSKPRSGKAGPFDLLFAYTVLSARWASCWADLEAQGDVGLRPADLASIPS